MPLKYLFIVTFVFIQIYNNPIHAVTTIKPDPDTKPDDETTVTTSTTPSSTQGATTNGGTDGSTSPTTTTTTDNPTTTTTTTQAPAAPELGGSCTNMTECESAISGAVVCDAGTCQCDDTNSHFEYNKTTCLEVTNLIPMVSIDDYTTTSVNVSWTHIIDTTNLPLTYNITAMLGSNVLVCVGDNSTAYCSVINLIPMVSIDDYTTTSVNVSWIHSIDTTNLPLTYNITAMFMSNVHVCVGDNSTAYCSGLVPGTLYNITVQVNLNNSLTVGNSTQASTRPAIPGNISLALSDLDGQNVTIVWAPSGGQAYYYTITSANFTEKNSTTTSLNLGQLRDGRTFPVTITAFSYGKASEPRQTLFKTIVKVPDPPSEPVTQRVSSGSVELGWIPPTDPRGEQVSYVVCILSKVYNDTDYTMPPYCNNTLVPGYISDNVTAGSFYSFDIKTKNEEFLSNGNLSIELRTNETAPGNVSSVVVRPVNDTLAVSWGRPVQPNGDIITYLLTWIETNSPAGNTCEVYFTSNLSQPLHMTSTDQVDCPNETVTIDVNERTMQYDIMDLKAFVEYTVSISAFTSVGRGPDVSITQQTSILKPDPVADVEVKVINSTSVNITWEIPLTNPGQINYTIDIQDAVFNNQSDVIPCYVMDYSSAACIQTGLRPFWRYRFSVISSNVAGESQSQQTSIITTLETAPGRVSKITPIPSVDCDATTISPLWIEPNLYERRANITKYVILNERRRVTEFGVQSPDPWNVNNRQFSYNVDVMAETSYNWQILAVSATGLMGNTTDFSFQTGNCKPPVWGNRQDISSTSVSLTGVTVLLDLTFFLDNTQGALTEKGLIVRFNDKMRVVNDIRQIGDFRNQSTFYRVDLDGLISGTQPEQQFLIGSDECLDISKQFCNRLLPQDTIIYIQGYVCTSGYKCTLSGWFGPYRTAMEDAGGISSGIIASIVILLLLVIAVSVFGLMWYRGVIDPPGWFIKDTETQPLTPLVPAPPSKNRPILVNRYSEVLEELHRDTNLKLSDQYEDIGRLSEEIKERSTFNAANIEANKPKNRWVNILPFDHSRVKLQQLDDDDPTSDYINANYMPGFTHQREYIASQGPLPGTVEDFWRMVWEQNVQVIVMLTQCREGNRIKCEMYWPDQLREPKQYGDIVVNPISISPLDKYNISIFQVTAYGQERQVTHLHYLDFPDFSANVEYDHFLDFVKTARGIVPHNNDGPIIVHCSAGVGRTGTFIAMDRLQMYLNSSQFSYDDHVDIFNIVISLRENRVSMVQTESQFVLIHDCFAKMLEAKRLSEMKSQSDENLYANDGFDPYPEVLYENINGRDVNRMMKTEL